MTHPNLRPNGVIRAGSLLGQRGRPVVFLEVPLTKPTPRLLLLLHVGICSIPFSTVCQHGIPGIMCHGFEYCKFIK
jgi:hypothetical protein